MTDRTSHDATLAVDDAVVHQPLSQPVAQEGSAEEILARLDRVLEITAAAEEEFTGGRPPARAAATPMFAVDLSVVIPVYNERETICEIVRRVQDIGLHHEIVIVDDCSTDGTRMKLKELALQPDVHVVYHERNLGKGAALRSGFLEATGNVVLIQDADLEYDPGDYPRLIAPIERGEARVVYGSRFLENSRQDPSWLHRFGNRLLTWASNRVTGARLTDMETCYKVFCRDLLDDIRIEQNRFGFEPEITAKLARRGVRILEVPIRYNCRSYAEGKKIGFRDALNACYCIVRYGLFA